MVHNLGPAARGKAVDLRAARGTWGNVSVRKIFRWTTHDDAARKAVRYWLSRPAAERVSAVETIRQATWESMVKLPRDWNERIDLLCSHRVRFLVVGAHALAVHGSPGATGDLDLFVEPTPENARRLGDALAAFAFPALAAQARRANVARSANQSAAC